MRQEICNAITNRAMLEFYHNNQLRIVEPFTLGMSKKRKIVLSAYQTGGTSNDREIPGWGLFSLDKISNLRVLNQNFLGNREGYSRSDSRMIEIYCEI